METQVKEMESRLAETQELAGYNAQVCTTISDELTPQVTSRSTLFKSLKDRCETAESQLKHAKARVGCISRFLMYLSTLLPALSPHPLGNNGGRKGFGYGSSIQQGEGTSQRHERLAWSGKQKSKRDRETSGDRVWASYQNSYIMYTNIKIFHMQNPYDIVLI